MNQNDWNRYTELPHREVTNGNQLLFAKQFKLSKHLSFFLGNKNSKLVSTDVLEIWHYQDFAESEVLLNLSINYGH